MLSACKSSIESWFRNYSDNQENEKIQHEQTPDERMRDERMRDEKDNDVKSLLTKVSEQLDFLLKDKSDMESRKQLEECFIDIFKMYREHTVKH